MDQYLKEKIDSFEMQLSKMTEAIITLAKVEERQLTHSKELDTTKRDIAAIQKDIVNLKVHISSTASKLKMGERAWWLIFAAVLAAGVKYGF